MNKSKTTIALIVLFVLTASLAIFQYSTIRALNDEISTRRQVLDNTRTIITGLSDTIKARGVSEKDPIQSVYDACDLLNETSYFGSTAWGNICGDQALTSLGENSNPPPIDEVYNAQKSINTLLESLNEERIITIFDN